MPRKSTRNAHGSGSIRQLPSGIWQGRYTSGRDPGTGKQKQHSVYGKTQAEARKKLDQAKAAVDAGTYIEPSKLTVGAWLDIWLAEYCVHVKQSTRDSYDKQIRVHIKPALAATKLSALAAPQIQQFYNAMKAEGLSPKTIRNCHGVLHKALDQALKLGYIRVNPSNASVMPRLEKAHQINPLDSMQLKLFLDAIQGHPQERLFIVDVFTGMRLSEIIGLTWDCIDFDEGSVTIYRQWQRLAKKKGAHEFVPPKNDKRRTIFPAPFVMEMLLEQRREQRKMRLQAGADWHNEENFVFTNEHGIPINDRTLYNQFKTVVKSIGLPDRRFHDLRHTYATTALRNGDSPKDVSETLGHATVSFTLDVYGHVTDEMKKRSADRMQAFIDGLA